MKYKYQLHTHTYPCSDCAYNRSVEQLVDALYANGFQGAVLTNHFRHGNCGIPRNLSWENFVEEYEKDYLKGKEYAQQYDMDILFGIEENVGNGLEILCYGITPQILYNHPELSSKELEIWKNVLSSYGALCIQAHPFRKRNYIKEPRLLPIRLIDGIEVFNAENPDEDNTDAKQAAKLYPDLILTSGADSHNNKTVYYGGIETDKRIKTEKELAEILKSGNYALRFK